MFVFKFPSIHASLTILFSLLLELTRSPSGTSLYKTAAEEAYETAVNTYTSRENRKIIWIQYLKHKQRQLEISESKAEGFKSLLDIAKRCLVCIPSDTTMPFECNRYWNDFSFHNQVSSASLIQVTLICAISTRSGNDFKVTKIGSRLILTISSLHYIKTPPI